MPALVASRFIATALLGFPVALAIGAATPAPAQAGDPPPKTRSVIVYGDDPCPASAGDEIVVCARQPEGERYRIPKQFRGSKAARSPAGNAWGNKVRETDQASRASAGVPNTCSAVGTGGQSGCFLQFQQQSAAERQARRNGEADDGGQP
ncbi:hypothetical protein [Sphingomonas sp.]|uniref:hypothetical protein n=1 Tax=Sphingomonas sp. TaxID=28214 RepID=UPI003B008F3C